MVMSPDASYGLFDTALGTCALAWGCGGLLGVWLPEASDSALEARIRRRLPASSSAAPTEEIAGAVEQIRVLLATGQGDLTGIALDMSGLEAFERAVYRRLRQVPAGQTITYGQIAREVGDVSDSRRVGQAMGRNRWPIVVPCHRVLGADGKAGGFSAPGGLETKLKLLAIERARVGDAPSLFDDLPLSMKPRT
jgi:methylated-DNA-[protein]-cysteine S-methyltransferase